MKEYIVKDMIGEFEDTDYPELIRCKDCKFNDDSLCTWHSGRDNKWLVDDNDFCSVGERE